MRRLWLALLRYLHHVRVVVSELLYRYRHIDGHIMDLQGFASLGSVAQLPQQVVERLVRSTE